MWHTILNYGENHFEDFLVWDLKNPKSGESESQSKQHSSDQFEVEG